MKKAFLYLCWIVTFCATFASCKPSLPRDVLSKGKMTDILLDYHIALAMLRVKTVVVRRIVWLIARLY